MLYNFIIVLIIILAIFYFIQFSNKNEGFRTFDSNSNIYESIGAVPNKLLYLTPPNPTQPNVDYQDYLNELSGYDAGTRGYFNPIYADDVAMGLDTN